MTSNPERAERRRRIRRPIGVQGEHRPVQSSAVTTRLADIAAQAGVSEATVSRVLNGKPGVAATTRQSVLAALDVLGYERPVRLRQRSEGLVGLITPELENPIFPALAQVIGQALTRQGYTPVLATQTPGGSTEDELTEMLVDRGRGRHHLRLRAARGHHRRHAALRAAARPGRALRAGGRLLAEGAGAVHLPRRPRGDEPGGHAPGVAGPHPDRPGARARSGSCRSSARSRASSARCRTSWA